MAIVGANLASNAYTSGSPQLTSSVSPTANRLVIVGVMSWKSGGATAATPTVTGASMTWTQIVTVVATMGASSYRTTLFRSLNAAPGSGQLTIDWGGQSQDNSSSSVDQFSGIDISGSNGANAIVQSATNSSNASATSITFSLAAFTSAANAAYGFAGMDGGGSTFSAGAGFTQLSLQGPAVGNFAEWALNTPSVVINFGSTSNPRIGAAIEIKAANSGFFPLIY